MRNFLVIKGLIFLLFISCVTGTQSGEDDEIKTIFKNAYESLRINEPQGRSAAQPLVLAHYMPWFQKDGFHWTEGTSKFNPSQILPDGRENIASHYYPLTGSYDSSDTLILDYQLALMKMSGMDGVIFDWYGITAAFDYKPIHDATLVMIDMIKKRGMKYLICYEDQSVGNMMRAGRLPHNTGNISDPLEVLALKTAKDTFNWMAENWFTDEEYVKVDGRPVVMCFGPQYFSNKADWDAIWTDLNPKPFFIDLNGRTVWADASMNWSPMHLSSANGILEINRLVGDLNNFYLKQEYKPFTAGTVFPAFHDIYAQAFKLSYGYLDYYMGETYKLTWEAALKARVNIIQIQTWNDYGEGTIVEPTIERGYKDLEFTQDKRKETDRSFPFNHTDLRIPLELYKIQSGEKSSELQKQQAAAIYDLIFSGKVSEARQAMQNAGFYYDDSVRPLLHDVIIKNVN